MKQTKIDTERARASLKRWLVKYTHGCTVNNGGYPCATCTIDLLVKLGVKEDGERNKPIDRINEVWRGFLQMRGEQ